MDNLVTACEGGSTEVVVVVVVVVAFVGTWERRWLEAGVLVQPLRFPGDAVLGNRLVIVPPRCCCCIIMLVMVLVSYSNTQLDTFHRPYWNAR